MRLFYPTDAAPEPVPGRIRVFIGGSIEMGNAWDWQSVLIAHLRTLPQAPKLDLFNPRRADWDPSWPNTYDFPPFKAQVDWEIIEQKRADIRVYYFADDTISPITLLEAGLFLPTQPVIGVGPRYKRAGNLMVLKDHYPMDIHTHWADFLAATARKIAGFDPKAGSEAVLRPNI